MYREVKPTINDKHVTFQLKHCRKNTRFGFTVRHLKYQDQACQQKTVIHSFRLIKYLILLSV